MSDRTPGRGEGRVDGEKTERLSIVGGSAVATLHQGEQSACKSLPRSMFQIYKRNPYRVERTIGNIVF